MNVASYLERIEYGGPTEPTAETLGSLHAAHLMAVPFENLDIHLGRPIVLDEGSLYRKIVEQWRGGFCYELNGLFAWLLRQIGFQVNMLSARVCCADGTYGNEFDHMALLVRCSSTHEPWVVDVGFGDSFLEPLRLEDRGQQVRAGSAFRIWQEGGELALDKQEEAGWKTQYYFTLTPRGLSDFEGMCRFHQTSRDSPFTRGRICTRATPTGRITLTGDRLIVTENGRRTESAIESEAAWRGALLEHFGVQL